MKVIAHENNGKEQQAALAKGGRGAPPADHQPNQMVSGKKESLTLGGVPVELYHWGPAHTNGDLVVLLPNEKTVFTGDIIAANRPEPLIHLEKNGSSEGWIETAKGLAALDAEIFIPGHGAPQTKSEIDSRISKAEGKRTKILDLISQGKSLDEIKAAVGDPATTPNGSGPNFPTFTEVVYQESARK